jgi:hypothetical protein
MALLRNDLPPGFFCQLSSVVHWLQFETEVCTSRELSVRLATRIWRAKSGSPAEVLFSFERSNRRYKPRDAGIR